jgi:hypothetical protein
MIAIMVDRPRAFICSPMLNQSNDWRAQRSLYMGGGVSTSQVHRQVSFTPSDPLM